MIGAGLKTREFGALGEATASKYLAKKGFRTVSKNAYMGKKELDLVAVGHGFILFVEVKTRKQIPDSGSPFGRPATAVNAKKRENLLFAARGFIHAHPELCRDLQPRIDVIEVYADPASEKYKVLDVRHFENAVTAQR